MDAKFSPDTSLIAFNRGPDLFVIDPNTNTEQRLTNANRGSTSRSTGFRARCSVVCANRYCGGVWRCAEDVTCGLADYIMQEEFDRFTGYWWCPFVAGAGTAAATYRILYLEVDESLVPTIGIARPTSGTVDTMRFPRAGQTNARSIVKIAQFKNSAAGGAVEHFELKVPVHDRWYERRPCFHPLIGLI